MVNSTTKSSLLNRHLGGERDWNRSQRLSPLDYLLSTPPTLPIFESSGNSSDDKESHTPKGRDMRDAASDGGSFIVEHQDGYIFECRQFQACTSIDMRKLTSLRNGGVRSPRFLKIPFLYFRVTLSSFNQGGGANVGSSLEYLHHVGAYISFNFDDFILLQISSGKIGDVRRVDFTVRMECSSKSVSGEKSSKYTKEWGLQRYRVLAPVPSID
ncbi:hypothetical protein C8Q75DRAFT_733615 [Abortiporus biennis]|nr:hypothetical protein C8Q75DRAFT_733615 [Abortiporus biennis]